VNQPNEITQLLAAAAEGDADAPNRLLPLVHAELRELAAAKMARLPPGNTLQPTALVHEAWIRLADKDPERGANRSRFMASAARAMRDILVEQARRKGSGKRGGDRARVEFDLVQPEVPDVPDSVLAIHEALEELEREDPSKAELVNLRFFAGLTVEETAAVMEMPLRTVEHRWQFIRRWLCRRLQQDNE
jgi:RNA polymerase sigma factor (TIGR02999 family)